MEDCFCNNLGPDIDKGFRIALDIVPDMGFGNILGCKIVCKAALSNSPSFGQVEPAPRAGKFDMVDSFDTRDMVNRLGMAE